MLMRDQIDLLRADKERLRAVLRAILMEAVSQECDEAGIIGNMANMAKEGLRE